MSRPSAVPARSACHRMSHLTSPEAEARSLAVSLCVVRLGPVWSQRWSRVPAIDPSEMEGLAWPMPVHQSRRGSTKTGRGRTRGRCWPSPGQGQTVSQLQLHRRGAAYGRRAGPGHLRPVRACLCDTAGEEAIPSRRGHAGEPGAMQAGQCRESPPSYAMPLWVGTEWADEGRCDPH